MAGLWRELQRIPAYIGVFLIRFFGVNEIRKFHRIADEEKLVYCFPP